jgi:hypothetical protein
MPCIVYLPNKVLLVGLSVYENELVKHSAHVSEMFNHTAQHSVPQRSAQYTEAARMWDQCVSQDTAPNNTRKSFFHTVPLLSKIVINNLRIRQLICFFNNLHLIPEYGHPVHFFRKHDAFDG